MIEPATSRDRTAYNAAQSEEKARFAVLLADLCRGVPEPEQVMGRLRLPLSDMVFAAAFKVYVGFSSRRFTTDLHEAYADGHVGRRRSTRPARSATQRRDGRWSEHSLGCRSAGRCWYATTRRPATTLG
jgi:hypothetical protein